MTINGIEFTLGKLAGKDVVLFLSGESMVNASSNTQLLLDRFNVKAIVFSGIAGGVNPALHIGDVVVAKQWGRHRQVNASDNGEVLLLLGATVYAQPRHP